MTETDIILKNIDKHCRINGVSRTEVSKAIHRSETTLEKCFLRKSITIDMARDVAGYFGLSFVDLLLADTLIEHKGKYSFDFFNLDEKYRTGIGVRCTEEGTFMNQVYLDDTSEEDIYGFVLDIASVCTDVTDSFCLFVKTLHYGWIFGAKDKYLRPNPKEPDKFIINTTPKDMTDDESEKMVYRTVHSMTDIVEKIVIVEQLDEHVWEFN